MSDFNILENYLSFSIGNKEMAHIFIKAASEQERQRIIELLDGLIPAKTAYEMPMDYWVQRKLVEQAIALIKGKTE